MSKDPTLREFYIFRHGETDWNAEGRFQGHIDVPLNDNGRSQAQALAQLLAQHRLEVILSSDLIRAYETARIIGSRLSLPILKDAGLREAFLGDAQGLTREEIEARFGTELAARWRSSHLTDADISYPGGETGNQIIQRVLASLKSFANTQPYRRIGIATHGGVIRRIMHSILPPDSPPVPIPNGVLYFLKYDLKTDRLWSPEE